MSDNKDCSDFQIPFSFVSTQTFFDYEAYAKSLVINLIQQLKESFNIEDKSNNYNEIHCINNKYYYGIECYSINQVISATAFLYISANKLNKNDSKNVYNIINNYKVDARFNKTIIYFSELEVD